MYQLLITKRNGRVVSSLFQEQRLVQVQVEPSEEETIVGNIYVGKVQNIVRNINAAFVQIQEDTICHLSLNEPGTPIFLNKKNTSKVCVGDELLVQVSKDAVKTKNPSATTKLQIAGKYAVLTYGDKRISISGKIKEPKTRKRLHDLVEQEFGTKITCGVIVRTNAENVAEEDFLRELRNLKNRYDTIVGQGLYRTRYSLLYEAPRGYLCDIRDGYDKLISKIITDDVEIYEQVSQYLENNQPSDLHKLELYEDEMLSLNQLYGIETKLQKALQERVWLKSGGYLIIEPTEALTVIDVNTGKAIAGKKDSEEHFLKINMEAANEIAAQLRLRNISGIILVDFIDMKDKKSDQILIEELKRVIRLDPVKTVFVDMTGLHLAEITRKKVRRPLHEQIAMCDKKQNRNKRN